MNDFEYDVMQKKRIANGAFHQKKGSKSRKCTLPHEMLTPAQRKKLDGPVETYAINRPMDWETFKSMPLDLQQAHLDFVQNRFDVGVNTVSTLVFGLSRTALRYHCDRLGLSYLTKQGAVNKGKKAAITEWLAQNEPVDPAEPDEPDESASENTACEPETEDTVGLVEDSAPARSMGLGLSALPGLLCGGEVHMNGLASDLLPALVALLGGTDAWMDVRFTFVKKKEEMD